MSWLDDMLTEERELVAIGNNKIVVTDASGIVKAGTQADTALQGVFDDRILNGSPAAGQEGLYNTMRWGKTIRTYTPLGTAADAANLQALATAMTGVGEVRVRPGSLTLTAGVTVGTDLVISHHPNTTIVAQMGPSAGYGNSVYTANGLFPGGGAYATSALAADAVAGTSTVVCASAALISIGSKINLGSSTDARISTYKVINKVGATLTLDRKLVKTFAMVGAVIPAGTTPPTITVTGSPASTVQHAIRIACTDISGGAARGQWIGKYTLDGSDPTTSGTATTFTSAATVGPTSGLTINIAVGNAAVNNTWTAVIPVVGVSLLIERVRLYGNGCLITDDGVNGGDRAFNLLPSWDGLIEDFRIAGRFTKFAASFDLGGYRNVMSKVRNDARDIGAGAGSSLAIESNEDSVMRSCSSDNVPSTLGAIAFPSCDNCHAADVHAKGASHSGIAFTVNNAGIDLFGSRGCSVVGGSFRGCLDGIEVSNGSQDIQIADVQCEENTTGGIHVLGTAAAPVDGVQIANARLMHNQNGLYFDGATGIVAKNIVTRDNTATQIYFINAARFEVDGWRSVSTNISSHMTNPAGTGTCEAHLRGFHWSSSGAAGGQDGFIWQGVADVWMSQGRCEWLGAGAGVALVDSSDAVVGNLYIDNVKMVASKGAAYGLYLGTSRVGYIGEGVDLSSATTAAQGGGGKRYGVAFTYAGSPENNVLADKGSYCRDTTNGAGYIKTTDGANTGWKLVTHA